MSQRRDMGHPPSFKVCVRSTPALNLQAEAAVYA